MKINEKTVSIIIPALNEEGNIQGSIDSAIYAAQKNFSDYEIIVVNDGSTDNTLGIVKDNMKTNNRIKVISHTEPRGFGTSYNTGRKNVKMIYCVMVHGDNAFDKNTLAKFFSCTGKADVICSYIANPEARSKTRQIISAIYTKLLNLIFNLNLRYFNGLQIHQTEWLKNIEIKSTGFGFQAELLIKAFRDGRSYMEVPYIHRERPGGGATKIFKPKNILSVIRTILYFISIKKNSGYSIRNLTTS